MTALAGPVPAPQWHFAYVPDRDRVYVVQCACGFTYLIGACVWECKPPQRCKACKDAGMRRQSC